MRALPFLTLLLFAPAAWAAGDCGDGFSECREDCTLQYGGSVRVAAKKKFKKCATQCVKKRRSCEERVTETRGNSLNEGALDKTPTSRDVDGDGLPTRTAVSKKDEDAPVSTRTRVEKVDEAPSKPAAASDGPATKPSESDRKEARPAARKDPGDDLRDDGDRPSDEGEDLGDDGPKKDKKRDRKRDQRFPEKEDDHDDLRYY